jgi:3,4-dihydroxy 2-butanone 4-phosphate synthase / GTP cyclohydrolase II
MVAKVLAYELRDRGLDTVGANLRLSYPTDSRDYRVGASILGIARVRLPANPAEVGALGRFRIAVAEPAPLITVPTSANLGYLRDQAGDAGDLLGHIEA